MLRWISILTLGAMSLAVSCSRSPQPASSSKFLKTSTNLTIFQVKGIVVELAPEEKTARIKHEEIPGYMAAMTMPFEVRRRSRGVPHVGEGRRRLD
jgi:Cu/Ag efflux protein CusF